MKRTFIGLVPVTLLATLTLACKGDDDPGTDEGMTETVGDGDGDQTGDGDGDGDGDQTGDGDGDGDQTGDGDGDGDPTGDTDTDMDGVGDMTDNCPDIANPNQRDFDDNGVGNVCDVQVFTTLSGTLNSTAIADAGFAGMCQIPIMIEVTGGEVRVQLDDDAAVAAFEIVSMQVADILDKQCMLAVAAEVDITNFMIANDGGAFPVAVPHTPAQHDAGSIAGDCDINHPVLSTGVLSASVNGEPPMDSDLMLPGTLPIFTANISGGGAMGTLAWADAQYVLAMDTFMIEDPLPIDIEFTLRGLVGSVVLMP
jgi:hypothetical protein